MNTKKRSSKQRSHGQNESSTPGSVLIKTTLVKSLQKRCTQHTDLALIKTSTDNSRWQTMRCSDDRISQNLYTSRKAYGNLVLQATLSGAKKLRAWLVLFSENLLPIQRYRSNPAEEIRFLEFFINLIKRIHGYRPGVHASGDWCGHAQRTARAFCCCCCFVLF